MPYELSLQDIGDVAQNPTSNNHASLGGVKPSGTLRNSGWVMRFYCINLDYRLSN